MEICPIFTDDGLIKEFMVDKLHIRQYENRDALGRSAAETVSDLMRKFIDVKGNVRMAFPSAMSHHDFFGYLSKAPRIDWKKIYAFYIDEYLGIPNDHPLSLCSFLTEHFISKVPGVNFFPMHGDAKDPEAECQRYAALINEAPIDIMMLGIGESGHLAFIDPPYCDFNDKRTIITTRIDNESFNQLVHDGCFESPDDVPRYAFSMTVQTCLKGRFTMSCVPSVFKAKAIKKMLEGPITTAVPASILQKQDNAWVFLDNDSASLLKQ
jgi:glucosamine-6-phosphate deaminase